MLYNLLILLISSSLLVLRSQTWHTCEENEEERNKSHYAPNSHLCIFQPSNTTYISVLVTVTQRQPQSEVNYFKEPFELYHVGKNLQHVCSHPHPTVSLRYEGGRLSLDVLAPPKNRGIMGYVVAVYNTLFQYIINTASTSQATLIRCVSHGLQCALPHQGLCKPMWMEVC